MESAGAGPAQQPQTDEADETVCAWQQSCLCDHCHEQKPLLHMAQWDEAGWEQGASWCRECFAAYGAWKTERNNGPRVAGKMTQREVQDNLKKVSTQQPTSWEECMSCLHAEFPDPAEAVKYLTRADSKRVPKAAPTNGWELVAISVADQAALRKQSFGECLCAPSNALRVGTPPPRDNTQDRRQRRTRNRGGAAEAKAPALTTAPSARASQDPPQASSTSDHRFADDLCEICKGAPVPKNAVAVMRSHEGRDENSRKQPFLAFLIKDRGRYIWLRSWEAWGLRTCSLCEQPRTNRFFRLNTVNYYGKDATARFKSQCDCCEPYYMRMHVKEGKDKAEIKRFVMDPALVDNPLTRDGRHLVHFDWEAEEEQYKHGVRDGSIAPGLGPCGMAHKAPRNTNLERRTVKSEDGRKVCLFCSRNKKLCRYPQRLVMTGKGYAERRISAHCKKCMVRAAHLRSNGYSRPHAQDVLAEYHACKASMGHESDSDGYEVDDNMEVEKQMRELGREIVIAPATATELAIAAKQALEEEAGGGASASAAAPAAVGAASGTSSAHGGSAPAAKRGGRGSGGARAAASRASAPSTSNAPATASAGAKSKRGTRGALQPRNSGRAANAAAAAAVSTTPAPAPGALPEPREVNAASDTGACDVQLPTPPPLQLWPSMLLPPFGGAGGPASAATAAAAAAALALTPLDLSTLTQSMLEDVQEQRCIQQPLPGDGAELCAASEDGSGKHGAPSGLKRKAPGDTSSAEFRGDEDDGSADGEDRYGSKQPPRRSRPRKTHTSAPPLPGAASASKPSSQYTSKETSPVPLSPGTGGAALSAVFGDSQTPPSPPDASAALPRAGAKRRRCGPNKRSNSSSTTGIASQAKRGKDGAHGDPELPSWATKRRRSELAPTAGGDAAANAAAAAMAAAAAAASSSVDGCGAATAASAMPLMQQQLQALAAQFAAPYAGATLPDLTASLPSPDLTAYYTAMMLAMQNQMMSAGVAPNANPMLSHLGLFGGLTSALPAGVPPGFPLGTTPQANANDSSALLTLLGLRPSLCD